MSCRCSAGVTGRRPDQLRPAHARDRRGAPPSGTARPHQGPGTSCCCTAVRSAISCKLQVLHRRTALVMGPGRRCLACGWLFRRTGGPIMPLIALVLVLLLLFGGGGFYFGGPAYGGGG